MIMKPYGRHKAFKECHCEFCKKDRHIKSVKVSERQRAKKEIKDEISKVGKKSDMRDGNS